MTWLAHSHSDDRSESGYQAEIVAAAAPFGTLHHLLNGGAAGETQAGSRQIEKMRKHMSK